MRKLRILKVLRLIIGAAILAVIGMGITDYWYRMNPPTQSVAQAIASEEEPVAEPSRGPAAADELESRSLSEAPSATESSGPRRWMATAKKCFPDITGRLHGSELKDIVSTISNQGREVEPQIPWHNWHYKTASGKEKRIRLEELYLENKGQETFEVKVLDVDAEGLPIVRNSKRFSSREQALNFVNETSASWRSNKQEVNRVWSSEDHVIDSVWVDDKVVSLSAVSLDGWFLECIEQEGEISCHCTAQ